jgi:metal-sulfur cluster biosynthetic enzyme
MPVMFFQMLDCPLVYDVDVDQVLLRLLDPILTSMLCPSQRTLKAYLEQAVDVIRAVREPHGRRTFVLERY